MLGLCSFINRVLQKSREVEEEEGTPRPLFITASAPSFKPIEGQGLGLPVTVQHSTSKGCPRLPRRDTTERNKAELSPWMLSGAASALVGCPRTACRKATRNAGAKALGTGQCGESASCRAAGAVVTLARPQRADTSCPLNKQTKRRAPRSTPPAGVLPGPACCHTRRAGAQARLVGARHRLVTSKGETAESPFGRIP